MSDQEPVLGHAVVVRLMTFASPRMGEAALPKVAAGQPLTISFGPPKMALPRASRLRLVPHQCCENGTPVIEAPQQCLYLSGCRIGNWSRVKDV